MDNFDDFIKKNSDIYESIKTENYLVITTKVENNINKMKCYNRDLALVWEICPNVLPHNYGNSFTGLRIINGLYFVNDFCGIKYQFDIETGEFLSREFVK